MSTDVANEYVQDMVYTALFAESMQHIVDAYDAREAPDEAEQQAAKQSEE